MQPALSVAEIRDLDYHTIHVAGVPGRLLMEVAGYGAYVALLTHLLRGAPSRPVLVAAGKGNNAGDGFVVARFLASQGLPVRVACVADPLTTDVEGDACANARLLAAYGVALEPLAPETAAGLCAQASVIVDGLLGTGLKGHVRAPYDAIIAAINASDRPVLALDLPSGLCGDTGRVLGNAIHADCTATFGALKTGLLTGLGPELSGQVELVPLPFAPRPA